MALPWHFGGSQGLVSPSVVGGPKLRGCYFISLPHTSLFCSVGVTSIYFLLSLFLCHPVMFSIVIRPSLLSDFVFFFLPLSSSFLSLQYQWDLAGITTNWPAGNRWHTQIQKTLGRFNQRTVKCGQGAPHKGWCSTLGLRTRELLPPLGPKGWGKEPRA